jgi:hypothetical protein
MSGIRPGATWSVLRAALVWAIVGMSVAAGISFIVIYFFALFVFVDAGLAALALGVIEGLWLYLEKSKTANAREFLRFGFISGAGLGLLTLPPALAQAELLHKGWLAPVVFVVAALVGGGVGGIFSARSFQIDTSSRQPSHSMLRLLIGYCLILAPLGVAEYLHYGMIVQTRLQALAVLSNASVSGLPPGNATGSQWSGCYSVDYHNIGESGVGGGIFCLTQLDGQLIISQGGDPDLEGGIDSDGRFWVGSDHTFNDLEARVLWKGKFVDNSRFHYFSWITVLQNGKFSNSVIATGNGYRRTR